MIIVNETYALEVDDLNYKLMKYKTIDPRNSPRFKEGQDDTIRHEWSFENLYYSKNHNGLVAALQEIARRQVNDKLTSDISLKEYIKELKLSYKSLEKAVLEAVN